MPESMAQSRTEVHNAPDCEMKPIWPGAGVAAAKLAFKWMLGTMIPRQFGPRIRIPGNFRCSTRIISSNFRPGSPISRKPAEMMTIPRVPASPSSRTSSGTLGAGVQITAKSGAWGRLAMFLNA